MLKLKEIIADFPNQLVQGAYDVEIKGIAYDSRKVEPGFLFACVQGYKTDGHKYIESALEKGAIALLVEKDVTAPANVTVIKTDDTRKGLALASAAFFGYPSDKLTMVGVTGTNGKTTTTYLIEEIIKENGSKVGLIGTINNKIGDTILPVTNTTPESLELQKLLREMVSFGAGYGVMEVSSHALELMRVAGCEYDIAVFTNITQDHLDFHETMDKYLQAKTKLFANLQQNVRKDNLKYGIINIDDPKGSEVVKATKGKVITYGIDNAADIKAEDVKITPAGVKFRVNGDFGTTQLNMNLTGKFNVYNTLAAFATGLALGFTVDSVKHALAKVKGVPGRFELVYAGQPFTVVVDYAHTPDGLDNIINTAKEFVENRIITVFGCGGDRDKTKRPIMGALAAVKSDFSVITSDNPRSEDPEAILKDIEAGVKPQVASDKYVMMADRRNGIKHALEMAKPGDVILIAGKGHENYQILKDETIHFDDREVALEVLKDLGYSLGDS